MPNEMAMPLQSVVPSSAFTSVRWLIVTSSRLCVYVAAQLDVKSSPLSVSNTPTISRSYVSDVTYLSAL